MFGGIRTRVICLTGKCLILLTTNCCVAVSVEKLFIDEAYHIIFIWPRTEVSISIRLITIPPAFKAEPQAAVDNPRLSRHIFKLR